MENFFEKNSNNKDDKEKEEGQNIERTQPSEKMEIELEKSERRDGNENENSEFSEDTRKELSEFFIETLKSEKEDLEEMDIVDKHFPNFKNLAIFNRAIQVLARDERVPEKDRMYLNIHQMNLSPIGATEMVPGVSSYAYSVKSIIKKLDELLTEEASLAVHAYAGKIFIPPAQEYKKYKEEHSSDSF